MNKLFTTIFSLTALSVIGQNFTPQKQYATIGASYPKPVLGYSKTAADTTVLGFDDFGQSVVRYSDPNGTNLFGKAQVDTVISGIVNVSQRNAQYARMFILPESQAYVAGALFFFSDKIDSTGDAKAKVKVMSIGANKAVSVADQATLENPDISGPDSILATGELLLSQVDTTVAGQNVPTSAIIFPVGDQPLVTSDFAISLDITELYDTGNSLGLYGGEQNSGQGSQQNFVNIIVVATPPLIDIAPFWAIPSAVYQQPGGGSIDPNLAIFAIISDEPFSTSIEEMAYFDGIKLMQNFPNPATDNATIKFDLQHAANNVSLKILDIKGSILSTLELGHFSAGIHSFDLNVNDLASGQYLYMLSADEHTLVKLMTIQK